MVEHNDSQVSLYEGGKKPKKADLVSYMLDKVSICNYYGHTYIETDGLWHKITELDFKSMCYAAFGAGIPSSHIRDLEHYFIGSHNILRVPSRLISFGGLVWSMEKCDFVAEPISKCFFRSNIYPNMKVTIGENQFIKDLACNDMGVYNDIFITLSAFSPQRFANVPLISGASR